MVRGSAVSLLRLLNDILDFSKIEAGKLELEQVQFEFRECVEKTVRTMAVRARAKKLELVCRIDPAIPEFLKGDPGRLRQILVNLVGNALKFTSHGEVLVRVALQAHDDESCRLKFTVSDTGIGIAEDKLAHIFDSFSQADNSMTRHYGGTGLGLAISSQLVSMMGGEIWVESQQGQGTNFFFTVVLAAGATSNRTDAKLTHLAHKRVLIVDDNQSSRSNLSELLKTWGLNSSLAQDGEEGLAALTRAANSNHAFDLAIIDCVMQNMNGFELVSRLRADPLLADTKVIVLSSATPTDSGRECQELNVSSHLSKPVIQSELLSAIRGAFESPCPAESKISPEHDKQTIRSLKILLVEDGFVNQRVAKGLLENDGHEVVVAENGRLAIERWQEEDFDLILMDVQMPVMDGIKATREIRRLEKATEASIPIIAMTAAAMSGDREKCIAAGMNDYLSKPVQPKEMRRVLMRFQSEDNSEPEIAWTVPAAEEPSAAADVGDCQPDAASDSPDNAPQMSRSLIAARKHLGGCNDDVLRQVATAFVKECPQRISEIHAALETKDMSGIARAAHTIKSAARIFEADGVSENAERIEHSARNNSEAEIGCAFEKLQANAAEVLHELQAYLDSNAPHS